MESGHGSWCPYLPLIKDIHVSNGITDKTDHIPQSSKQIARDPENVLPPIPNGPIILLPQGINNPENPHTANIITSKIPFPQSNTESNCFWTFAEKHYPNSSSTDSKLPDHIKALITKYVPLRGISPSLRVKDIKRLWNYLKAEQGRRAQKPVRATMLTFVRSLLSISRTPSYSSTVFSEDIFWKEGSFDDYSGDARSYSDDFCSCSDEENEIVFVEEDEIGKVDVAIKEECEEELSIDGCMESRRDKNDGLDIPLIQTGNEYTEFLEELISREKENGTFNKIANEKEKQSNIASRRNGGRESWITETDEDQTNTDGADIIEEQIHLKPEYHMDQKHAHVSKLQSKDCDNWSMITDELDDYIQTILTDCLHSLRDCSQHNVLMETQENAKPEHS